MNPFDPNDDARDRPDEPIEAALRASLAAHARRAPDPDALTERILAAADRPSGLHPPDRAARSPWRTWGLPLVAAASVAAIVGGVVGLSHVHLGSDHPQAATQRPSVSAAQTPTPSPPPSSKVHVVQPPASATFTPSSATSTPTDTSTLHSVKVVDLTFTGTNTGFALESANCILTSGRCTALETTTDGTTWTSHDDTPFEVPGISAGCPASTCVDHIRFASDQIGYVYGPDALFMTTDGAQHWTQLSGGADALETLDHNVIRVSESNCSAGCDYTVQTAPLGQDRWTTVPLPGGPVYGNSVTLSRGGAHAYLLLTKNPASGAGTQTSTLYRSDDDGSSWQPSGEPCPQYSGEVDSYSVTAGVNDDVTVLCRPRQGNASPYRVATSTNGGVSFSAKAGRLAFDAVADTGKSSQSVLAGDPGTVLAVAGAGVSISTDGGATWQVAGDVSGRTGFVGFESTTVGRAVSTDGRTIWTTYDAGRSWTRTPLG
jgi:hypothetical protein